MEPDLVDIPVMDRDHFLRVGKRTLGIALIGGLLVAATIVSDPRDSSAEQTNEWFNANSFPKIGELVGQQYVVRLYAAPEGTLYTVCSLDGDVLAQDLTSDEVTRVFPDIDMNLHAGPDLDVHEGGPDFVIMSADPGT